MVLPWVDTRPFSNMRSLSRPFPSLLSGFSVTDETRFWCFLDTFLIQVSLVHDYFLRVLFRPKQKSPLYHENVDLLIPLEASSRVPTSLPLVCTQSSNYFSFTLLWLVTTSRDLGGASTPPHTLPEILEVWKRRVKLGCERQAS